MSHFPAVGGIVRQKGKEVELVVSNIEDEKLLRLLKRSSKSGMNQLIEKYGALAACIVRSRISSVCNEYDVEECVAEVFAELYEQRSRIDLNRGSLKAYISLIARRRAIDKFNAAVKNVNRTAQLDESCNDIVSDEESTPEAAAMQRFCRICPIRQNGKRRMLLEIRRRKTVWDVMNIWTGGLKYRKIR